MMDGLEHQDQIKSIKWGESDRTPIAQQEWYLGEEMRNTQKVMGMNSSRNKT